MGIMRQLVEVVIIPEGSRSEPGTLIGVGPGPTHKRAEAPKDPGPVGFPGTRQCGRRPSTSRRRNSSRTNPRP
jgi:hypothetical protein